MCAVYVFSACSENEFSMYSLAINGERERERGEMDGKNKIAI